MELSDSGCGLRKVSWDRVVHEVSDVSSAGDDVALRARLLELTRGALASDLAV
jgi:hypothetical protein